MSLPIRYNIRNMILRKSFTIMTTLGIAMTVMTAVFLMMLLAGISAAFDSTGDPLNVLVMRTGSTSELVSRFTRDKLPILSSLPGIAKDSQGQPMVSGEWIALVPLARKDGAGEANVTLRGIGPQGLNLRPRVKLVAGTWFASGERELAVSQTLKNRFSHLEVGGQVDFGRGPWKVVGTFDAGSSAYESELWGDFNQVTDQFDGKLLVCSVVLHAMDPMTADALRHRVSDDQRIQLEGTLEPDYYAKQTRSGIPIRIMAYIVAITMAIGSIFAAANTMYAAVAYRSREIATLRVMGFRRSSILLSFVFESVLVAILGAAVGILLMLPFNGMSTGTSNTVTFSEVVFRMQITPGVVAYATLFAVIMGFFGGVAPAWRAARCEIVAGLRD